jgi:hypothetical protein
MATKDTILQVKTSFSATLDGGPVFFRAGELIDADHPAVKKWPQYFGPANVDHRSKPEPKVEQATAAPGEKRGA